VPRPLTPLTRALLFVLFAAPASAADWPSFRGPGHNGQVAAPGVFEGETVGLAIGWKHRLGPGYSGIAVAGGRVLTLGSEGDSDVLVALDAERGEELWRYKVGPRTRGHDGSEDGPSVTPVVDGDLVFGASSRARFFALDLASGREVWSVSLVDALGATVPLYDYASSPLVAGGLVIAVAPGAAAGTLAALDRATGVHRWSAAPGQVDYQTPVRARLLGREQIVHWLNERVVAVDLEGKEIWSAAAGGNQDSSPLPIGEDRVLLYGFDASTMLRLREERGAAGVEVVVEKLWESRDFKGGNMSAPVFHDGHLYGFDRAFLSCVDAATGARRWKSRPPGGSGLILVEDRLVVYGADGDVVIARATPDKYTEETRLRATDRQSLTWPAFASGRVFVRDASHVAAIRVTDQPTPEALVAEEEPALVEGTAFTAFVRSLDAAPDAEAKRLLLDGFFREERRYPLLEGDVVHFVYRGPARDVAVLSPVWDPQEETPLVQVAGTDFFYRSMRLEPMARLEYLYRVDFDTLTRDPLVPRSVPPPAPWFPSAFSESVPDGWVDASYLERYAGERRGRIERFELESKNTGDKREIAVYLPASASPTGLVVVVDGTPWLGAGQMPNTLDHLTGASIAPIVVAFVPPLQGMWFLENDGRLTAALTAMLSDELVPELRRRFGIPADRERTVVLGTDTGAPAVLYTALTRPDVFGRAVLLEYPGTFGLVEELERVLAAPAAAGAPRASFVSLWNRHGTQIRPRGFIGRDNAVALAAKLRELGYPLEARERVDGYGWGAWRVMAAEALQEIFPAGAR
jgi:outer membrane protein assembly factor BamB